MISNASYATSYRHVNKFQTSAPMGQLPFKTSTELDNRRNFNPRLHQLIPNSRMLWVIISMQGIGTVAIDGSRLEEFLRSRKEFLEVSQGGVSQGVLQTTLYLHLRSKAECTSRRTLNHFE